MQTQQTYTQDIQAPLVSFIITTYNLPIQYLKECIDSILQLSLNAKEREIILVDDGSDICPLDEWQSTCSISSICANLIRELVWLETMVFK